MANDCTLSGLYPCDKFSVGGIRKIWLVPFGDVYNYIYTNDELGKVTTFSSYTLPVEYKTLNGEFIEEYQGGQYNNYIHSLTTSLARLDYQSRNEFEKMVGSYVTAIFKDANGKCWIAGFDRPLKVNRFRAGTGGDASLYTYTMTGNSRFQVKEIECFDFACFASFNGTILRTSTFVIETASTYDFSADWQIVGNTDLLTYTPNQPLDPTDWSTPATYAQDLAELTNLIGNPGTSITLDYDGGLDTATITLQSVDTAYDFLVFNNQTAITSTVADTLNLQLLLSAAINTPGTTVTVTDDTLATVYTGQPSDAVVGAGLSGTVSNALIDISLLYPSGTTFTATVENDFCETKMYTFVLEQLADCNATFDVAYNYGHTYTIEIPENTTFGLGYQKLILFYDEYQFNIISNVDEAVVDVAALEPLVLAELTADPNSPIVSSSITVTNPNPGFATIQFTSTRRNSVLFANFTDTSNQLVYVGGIQTNLMNINSLVPNTSNISIVNQATTDELAGLFGNAPTVNDGYTIEDFDDVPGTITIDDIAFDINAYVEDEAWAVGISSSSCPETNNELNTAVCYDDRTLTITRRYDRFTMDASALTTPEVKTAYLFDYNIDATNYVVAVSTLNNVVGNANTDELSQNVIYSLPLHNGEYPVKVLNYAYNDIDGTYTLELDCSIDVVWNSLEGSDIADNPLTFTLIESYDITDLEFDPIINPHTLVIWAFNDVDTNPVAQAGEASASFINPRNATPFNVGRFYYDSGALTFDVEILGINPDEVVFNFYDVSFALLGSRILTSPTLLDSFAPVFAAIDVKWVSMTNNSGMFYWVSFDSTTQSDVDVFITTTKCERSVYGRFDHFYALTPVVFVPTPTIVSLLCP